MIYLIDTIGNETGMHLYDITFVEKCAKEKVQVSIISNFSDERTCLRLHNYYHGNIIRRFFFLFIDWWKLLYFRFSHQHSFFIYQSFGLRFLDIIFFIIFSFNNNTYLLVHDIYELTPTSAKDKRINLKKIIYRLFVKKYICHSRRVEAELKEICLGYKKKYIYYPHFDYTFSTSFDESKICNEVINLVDNKKINLLFFGQISLTKGVDILLQAYDKIDERFNIIIAGLDKGNLLQKYRDNSRLRIINRYILDDELNFLFSKVQIVLLPYKEIFQSGVLETVVHFKKIAVLSSVPSFEEFLYKYPSFGVNYSPNTPEELAECINGLSLNELCYSEADVEKYVKDHDIKILIDNLFYK